METMNMDELMEERVEGQGAGAKLGQAKGDDLVEEEGV